MITAVDCIVKNPQITAPFVGGNETLFQSEKIELHQASIFPRTPSFAFDKDKALAGISIEAIALKYHIVTADNRQEKGYASLNFGAINMELGREGGRDKYVPPLFLR